jgi:TatD DNase family protein
MLVDAHCHPCDLTLVFPECEQERRDLGILALANACTPDDFAHNEILASKALAEKKEPLFLCFGIHPQFFKHADENENVKGEVLLETLVRLAEEERIAGIGECGFDLYNAAFRETEKLQDKYFTLQIETALKYELPVIIHARHAMHKIFASKKSLTRCKAVIFHSCPCTLEEAQALLRCGVNAFFSFGNIIILNHKQAIRCCSLLPAERLLTETDAPYAPQRGQSFSTWKDLPLILEAASALRCQAGNNTTPRELEMQIEANFRTLFDAGKNR